MTAFNVDPTFSICIKGLHTTSVFPDLGAVEAHVTAALSFLGTIKTVTLVPAAQSPYVNAFIHFRSWKNSFYNQQLQNDMSPPGTSVRFYYEAESYWFLYKNTSTSVCAINGKQGLSRSESPPGGHTQTLRRKRAYIRTQEESLCVLDEIIRKKAQELSEKQRLISVCSLEIAEKSKEVDDLCKFLAVDVL